MSATSGSEPAREPSSRLQSDGVVLEWWMPAASPALKRALQVVERGPYSSPLRARVPLQQVTSAASVPKQAIVHPKAVLSPLWHRCSPKCSKFNALGEQRDG